MFFELFQKLWDDLSKFVLGWQPNFFFWSIRPAYYEDDFLLEVPYEPNRGNPCASSCITMMARYYGLNVNFEDVIKIAGAHPIIDYNGVYNWLF